MEPLPAWLQEKLETEGKTNEGQDKIANMLRRIYTGVVAKGASKGKLASLESIADRACCQLGLPYGWLTRMGDGGKGHGPIPIMRCPPALPHKADPESVKRRVSFDDVVVVHTPSKTEDTPTVREESFPQTQLDEVAVPDLPDNQLGLEDSPLLCEGCKEDEEGELEDDEPVDLEEVDSDEHPDAGDRKAPKRLRKMATREAENVDEAPEEKRSKKKAEEHAEEKPKTESKKKKKSEEPADQEPTKTESNKKKSEEPVEEEPKKTESNKKKKSEEKAVPKAKAIPKRKAKQPETSSEAEEGSEEEEEEEEKTTKRLVQRTLDSMPDVKWTQRVHDVMKNKKSQSDRKSKKQLAIQPSL